MLQLADSRISASNLDDDCIRVGSQCVYTSPCLHNPVSCLKQCNGSDSKVGGITYPPELGKRGGGLWGEQTKLLALSHPLC